MLLINDVLAITNGTVFQCNHLTGQYADGTVYYLQKLQYGIGLVIETKMLVEDTTDTGILQAIDEGKMDIFPLTTHRGKNAVITLRKNTNRKIEAALAAKAYQDKLDYLNAKYPQIPPELLAELRNHDWHFKYSDDIKIYRRGNKEKEYLMTKLKEIGAEDHYKEYLNI